MGWFSSKPDEQAIAEEKFRASFSLLGHIHTETVRLLSVLREDGVDVAAETAIVDAAAAGTLNNPRYRLLAAGSVRDHWITVARADRLMEKRQSHYGCEDALKTLRSFEDEDHRYGERSTAGLMKSLVYGVDTQGRAAAYMEGYRGEPMQSTFFGEDLYKLGVYHGQQDIDPLFTDIPRWCTIEDINRSSRPGEQYFYDHYKSYVLGPLRELQENIEATTDFIDTMTQVCQQATKTLEDVYADLKRAGVDSGAVVTER